MPVKKTKKKAFKKELLSVEQEILKMESATPKNCIPTPKTSVPTPKKPSVKITKSVNIVTKFSVELITKINI